MSGLTIGIYILMIAAILAAIFAIEYKHLMVSVISLIAMNLAIWGVLLLFEATLLAWIQVIVYGGGLTALFIAVVALTEKQKDETFSWKRTVIAFVAVAIIVGILIWAIIQYDITSITGSITGFGDLWGERATDVILQGIIFFAVSVGIGALFFHQKKKKIKEETKV
jgi:NADH:ubiquinone oxidoreductase subunit 6 (subunit J)